MGKLQHEHRIQPERLRPVDLPAKCLIGLVVSVLASFAFVTAADAFSTLIG